MQVMGSLCSQTLPGRGCKSCSSISSMHIYLAALPKMAANRTSTRVLSLMTYGGGFRPHPQGPLPRHLHSQILQPIKAGRCSTLCHASLQLSIHHPVIWMVAP